MTDPAWKVEGLLDERGRPTTRFYRAPDKAAVERAFGTEGLRIQRVDPTTIGPATKPPRSRRQG